ncbi:DUF1013 domain-containing protein [Micavibrio aeruginosavorus]|uniref:Cytoplasmic protein n=1 Tax=Micavibrio aeruginosavorus EPB TaxID=349215 RepID=M4VG82_9BACT|nr:DUF1013 domain-containing protein [Micavibrio aeruginosavorus]AGH98392.1 hypothetical protein A11S_1588 [Micavibrio aeruginosavorus EPB]
MAEKHVVSGLLMPKATAVWMIENTLLTFGQIADFTGLHEIEIQALADEEVGRGIVGRNPVENHELTQDELDKATADSNYRMRMARTDLPTVKLRAKGPRYTPVSKRADKPDAIAYILKHHPEISDAQICKLVGTTKPTIDAVRTRSHPNSANLRPRHPVDLGLCTYAELEGALKKGLKAAGKDTSEIEAQKQKMYESQEKDESADNSASFDFSNFVNKTGTDNNSGE